jgi:glycine/D-amino acid oxidase-like deaminating enzyme
MMDGGGGGRKGCGVTDGKRVAVIGGGIVGLCVSVFLARGGHAGEIVVIERDPSYARASTALSAAGLRTQFSLPLNVDMSRFGAAFLRPLRARIGWHGRGYLVLARDAAVLRANYEMQVSRGARLDFLDPAALVERFPALSAEGIAAGVHGGPGDDGEEGWFDAQALLGAVREEAAARGVRMVRADAAGLDIADGRVRAVRLADGERIAAAHVVNAAGALAGRVAAWAGADLPIVPRKRTVFVLRAPLDGAGLPLILDPSGAWLRPEGAGFIAGIALPPDRDPDAWDDFEPDLDLLEEVLWPLLAARIPAFAELRRVGAWAGHYEQCTLDSNALIGAVPGCAGFYVAAGFSGHGVQHAPAAGRGIAELILHGEYRALDLSPLGCARVAAGAPLCEGEIY